MSNKRSTNMKVRNVETVTHACKFLSKTHYFVHNNKFRFSLIAFSPGKKVSREIQHLRQRVPSLNFRHPFDLDTLPAESL